jgi:hypothetical protein
MSNQNTSTTSPTTANIHTLVSGAKLISLSPHQFQFSDGTTSEPQEADVVGLFTLKRELTPKGQLAGMAVNETAMRLSAGQQEALAELAGMADLVILPFPVLTALREQGIRDQFPNCVAFNATQDTQRSPPNEKVVDIQNWSY